MCCISHIYTNIYYGLLKACHVHIYTTAIQSKEKSVSSEPFFFLCYVYVGVDWTTFWLMFELIHVCNVKNVFWKRERKSFICLKVKNRDFNSNGIRFRFLTYDECNRLKKNTVTFVKVLAIPKVDAVQKLLLKGHTYFYLKKKKAFSFPHSFTHERVWD